MDVIDSLQGAMGIVLGVLVVSLLVVGPWLKRIDPGDYERQGAARPYSGWGLVVVLVSIIWPIVVAPVVGVVFAVLAWNLWLLPIVVLAGAALGIVVGIGLVFAILAIDKYWFQLGSITTDSVLPYLSFVVGPAVAVLVGWLLLTYVPDLSLPWWVGILAGVVPAYLAWRVFGAWRSARAESAQGVWVPDMRGLRLYEAREIAEAIDLDLRCAASTPSPLGDEVVVAQDPAPEERIEAGSALLVRIVPPPEASEAGQ